MLIKPSETLGWQVLEKSYTAAVLGLVETRTNSMVPVPEKLLCPAERR